MTTPAAGTLDPEEVQIGTANGPGIYVAPPGTELPAALTEDFAAPWAILGYLSDDGPTVGQTTDSESITPWQSRTPIRTVVTERGVTLQFVMWQLNRRTLALYFDTPMQTGTGDDVDMIVRSDAPQGTYAVAIDSRDGTQVFRLGFYRANLSDAGDMQITKGAAIPLDVTLSALDDAGKLAHVMLGQGAATPAFAQAAGAATEGERDQQIAAGQQRGASGRRAEQ